MKRRSEEATSRPPQLPRRLRPSAVASRGTRHSISDRGSVGLRTRLRSAVSEMLSWRRTRAARARGSAVAHFDADRVPAAVLLSGRPDSRDRYCWLNSSAMLAVAGLRSRASRMISVRPPLSSVRSRSATTLTRSSFADRRRPAIRRRRSAAAGASALPAGRGRRGTETAPASARAAAAWRCAVDGLALAVDADRVDEHLALANQLLHVADAGACWTCRCRPKSAGAPSSDSVPRCASGIASAMASYIAVPPFGDDAAERARQQLPIATSIPAGAPDSC